MSYKYTNMKFLNFKDFMKKYNLKNDTMNESQLQKFYNYPYTQKILKFIQTEDLLISMMDDWVVLIGHVL